MTHVITHTITAIKIMIYIYTIAKIFEMDLVISLCFVKIKILDKETVYWNIPKNT